MSGLSEPAVVMDMSSIITQVNGPHQETKRDGKNEKVITKHKEAYNGLSPNDTMGQPKAQPDQRTGSGGGVGSRFLSQLLCCFGIGHTPDFVGPHQQQRQQPQQGELSEHSGPQQLSNGLEVSRCDEAEVAEQQPSSGGGCLLAAAEPGMTGRICAVIDLDETLVHSSFRPIGSPDFSIEVEVDGVTHQVYVLKRPYADEFLARMGELFECVLFTASMGKYADPVSDLIDPGGAFKHRLFREACVYHYDSYVKDLATLGRPVDRCVIIDNSPASYMFNTENAIRVQSWLGEPEDTELRDLLPYLEQLAEADSVSAYLRSNPPPQCAPLTAEQMLAHMQEMEDEC